MNVLIAQGIPQEGYSLFSLFIQATFLVQFVMVGLIVASVICWGIIFEKFFLVNRVRRATEKF